MTMRSSFNALEIYMIAPTLKYVTCTKRIVNERYIFDNITSILTQI